MSTAKVQIGKQLDTHDRAKVDAKDQAIAEGLEAAYNQVPGPLLGALVRIGGKLKRIAHLYENGTFQACDADSGAFFISAGWASHSGGLDFGLHDRKKLKRTDEVASAEFWFFHNKIVQGGGRVDMTMDVPVWTF